MLKFSGDIEFKSDTFGVVRLPPGRYYLDKPMQLTSGSIVGSGVGETLIFPAKRRWWQRLWAALRRWF